MVAFVLFLNQIRVIDSLLVALSIIIFSTIASVIPDIDSTKSRVRDRFSMLIAGVIVLYLFISLTIESITTGVLGFIIIYLSLRFFPTKHRGITHNLKFGLVFSIVSSFIIFVAFGSSFLELAIYFIAIFFGHFSHILIDKLS